MFKCKLLGDLTRNGGIKMAKTIKGRIFGFGLVSALLLSLFIYPSGNVSAAEINSSQKSNITTAATNSYYVSELRRYSSFPPATIYHEEVINGFLYGGTLNRFDYAYDPDAKMYLVTYKGYIYAK